MPGLIGFGQDLGSQGRRGFSRLAAMESRRNRANEQLEAREDAMRDQNIATGAGMGLAYGMAAGPGGALVGAGIGAAAGWLVSSIF